MSIGSLREKSLHNELKAWYAQPGDQFEVPVEGYVVDIVRGSQLIEIQTRNFSALRGKLEGLLERYSVVLVYPIPREKWILRTHPAAGDMPISRRKSPRRGKTEDLFYELVYIPRLALHPNFRLEVLMTSQEEIWLDNGRGSWRRKGWSIADRRLLDVHQSYEFTSMEDYARLIPAQILPDFTSKELALALEIRPALAQKMVYSLHQMGILEISGYSGRARRFHILQQ